MVRISAVPKSLHLSLGKGPTPQELGTGLNQAKQTVLARIPRIA